MRREVRIERLQLRLRGAPAEASRELAAGLDRALAAELADRLPAGVCQQAASAIAGAVAARLPERKGGE